MRESGDLSHQDGRHICELCGCGNVGGSKTTHTGWGLCWTHERYCSPQRAQKIADDHLQALQQHRPFCINYEEAVADIVEKGMDVVQRVSGYDMDLYAEVNRVREILQGFYDKCLRRPDPESVAPQVAGEVRELREFLKTHQEFTADEKAMIFEELEYIETLLSSPLTEYVQGKLMPMSDATMLRAVTLSAPQLATAMRALFDIAKQRWFTEQNFQVWLMRSIQAIQRRFPGMTVQTDSGPRLLSEQITNLLVDAGEPVRGD